MTKHIFWIVSYPKSGNTLLRAILSSLFFTPDGNFTFEVQSIDRDINYSKPLSAKFSIKHPWYKEARTAVPFWGIILLIIGLSGYSTNNYLKQRKLSLQLEEEAAEKDRIARKNLEEKNFELQESQKAAEAANEVIRWLEEKGYRSGECFFCELNNSNTVSQFALIN